MADKKRKRTEPTDERLPFKNKLKPDSVILEILKQLKTSTASSSGTKTLTLQELSLPFQCREVADLSLSSVQSNIESLALKIAHSILSGNGFAFDVPSRSSANQLYVPELDRIVLKDKSSLRPFANVSTVRKTTITARILQLIHQLCLKGIHVTKRDLFYTDVKLFQDQVSFSSFKLKNILWLFWLDYIIQHHIMNMKLLLILY
jgi:meiotic recombination protein SPO11